MSLSNADRNELYSELSQLIGAGFPIGQAVQTLLDHELPASQQRVVTRLDRALRAGKDLATALEEALGKQTEELDIALVRAGQEGGRLPESLDALARHYQRRHQTTRTIRSQLIYPAALLHLGLLLPTLPKIIAKPDLAPLLTALATLVGLWVLLLAGYLVLRQLNHTATSGALADTFLNRIPFYGKMRKNGALSRFTAVLGFFLTAGQTVSASLRAAGRGSGSGLLLSTSGGAASDIERQGSTLGDAIAGRPGIPKALLRGIRTAEARGGLDTEMERWSKLYAEATEDAARSFGAWVPRIVYFIIVVVVAWQIIQTATAVYRPMFEMLDRM